MVLQFHSTDIRDALVEIIANHKDVTAKDAGKLASIGRVYGSSYIGTAYKRNSGNSSSSSDDDENVTKKSHTLNSDDDDNDNSSVSSDDDASSSPSLEAVDEEDTPSTTSTTQQQQGGGRKGNKPKRSKNKKTKDDMQTKLGQAPSILLPFHDHTDSSTTSKTNKQTNKQALEVPNVLLPVNYLRDYPFQVSNVAQTLLDTWNTMNAPSPQSNDSSPTIIVVLIQSGRFASAVFNLQSSNKHTKDTTPQMIAHKTSTRYTVRKGQGGSQSSHDQNKSKAKSVGAQLRREGEKQLRHDVHTTFAEWKKLNYIQRSALVLVSCPKSMKRDYLYSNDNGSSNGLLDKNDERWRSIPLDVGKPTLEATSAVLDCILSCNLRNMTDEEYRGMLNPDDDNEKDNGEKVTTDDNVVEKEVIEEEASAEPEVELPPLTPLHHAVVDGDLTRLVELLNLLDESEQQAATGDDGTIEQQPVEYDVNTTGGPDNQTALHLAASSTHQNAPSLLNALLIQGHANPCAIDSRGRPPYFVTASDKLREAFRLARGTLGEDYCSWDDDAKVGPPLSEDDVQLKKQKAAEKKRKQRARQKERKAAEKAAAEEAAMKERQEAEKKQQEEDAKRMRDGLKPKTKASNACDYCQKVTGKRRSQMFQKLDYVYCSSDCVKKHQRELSAAAAAKRMGSDAYSYKPK